MKQAYCTSLDADYLDRGLALIESLEEWCQPFRLWVLAWDSETATVLARLNLPNMEVLSVEAVEFPELAAIRDERSWMDYVLTCKPSLMACVMGRARPDPINYVDGDCYYFGRPDTVLEEIGEASIAITPHRFPPQRSYGVERAGMFNAGWIHMRRGGVAVQCLERWHQQCLKKCSMAGEERTVGDQKYLAEWPERWGAYPVQHKGMNLAPWNQGDQYVYTLRDGQVFVDEDPLVLYHFHQGLEPAYVVDSFVQSYLYLPYEKALKRAARRRAECM